MTLNMEAWQRRSLCTEELVHSSHLPWSSLLAMLLFPNICGTSRQWRTRRVKQLPATLRRMCRGKPPKCNTSCRNDQLRVSLCPDSSAHLLGCIDLLSFLAVVTPRGFSCSTSVTPCKMFHAEPDTVYKSLFTTFLLSSQRGVDIMVFAD